MEEYSQDQVVRYITEYVNLMGHAMEFNRIRTDPNLARSMDEFDVSRHAKVLREQFREFRSTVPKEIRDRLPDLYPTFPFSLQSMEESCEKILSG